MAKYTISLREIAQRDTLPGEDMLNQSDLLNIMKRGFFKDVTLTPIEEKYRNPFILGFANHFIPDDYELYCETESLAKIKFNSLIIDNANLVNDIFNNIDKNIFADYSVRKVKTHDESEESNENNQHSESSQGGSITHEHRGTKNIANDIHSIGNESSTDGSTQNNTSSNEGHNYEVGSYRDTNHSQDDTTNSNVSKHNQVGIAYDGPQGAIGGQMVQGSNSREGQGVSFVTDNTFNYMSAGNENDESTHDSGTGQSISNGYTERTFNDYDNHTTGSGTSSTTGSSTHEGDNEVTTDNDTLETYNEDNIEKRATTDENDVNATGSSNKSNDGTVEEENYSLNYDLVMNVQPFLSKIWHLFDDLWLEIY